MITFSCKNGRYILAVLGTIRSLYFKLKKTAAKEIKVLLCAGKLLTKRKDGDMQRGCVRVVPYSATKIIMQIKKRDKKVDRRVVPVRVCKSVQETLRNGLGGRRKQRKFSPVDEAVRRTYQDARRQRCHTDKSRGMLGQAQTCCDAPRQSRRTGYFGNYPRARARWASLC